MSRQLINSAKYFLESLDRVYDDDYIPTVEDVLRVHVHTKGTNVEEYSYTQDGIHKIDVISMTGQCAERLTKWASCFCGVASILYLVDVSEYDKVVRSPVGGQNMNCLERSMQEGV